MAAPRKYDALAIALLGWRIGFLQMAREEGFDPPPRLKINALLTLLILTRIYEYRRRRKSIPFVEARDIEETLQALNLPAPIRITRECLHWLEENHYIGNIIDDPQPFTAKRYVPALRAFSLLRTMRYRITGLEGRFGERCKGPTSGAPI